MVNFDPSKVYFITSSTVDKIVEEGTFSYTVGAGSPTAPTTTTQTQTHSYGSSVWIEGQFSIDGTNYHPIGVILEGAIDGGSRLRQSVYCYAFANATNVSFYMENRFTSNVTFSFRYALESLS